MQAHPTNLIRLAKSTIHRFRLFPANNRCRRWIDDLRKPLSSLIDRNTTKWGNLSWNFCNYFVPIYLHSGHICPKNHRFWHFERYLIESDSAHDLANTSQLLRYHLETLLSHSWRRRPSLAHARHLFTHWDSTDSEPRSHRYLQKARTFRIRL